MGATYAVKRSRLDWYGRTDATRYYCDSGCPVVAETRLAYKKEKDLAMDIVARPLTQISVDTLDADE